MVAATLAAPLGEGRGLLDPPWPSSFSALTFAALLAAPFGSIRSAVYTRRCAFFRAVLPATSRGREAMLEWRLEGMGPLLSDRFTNAEPREDFL